MSKHDSRQIETVKVMLHKGDKGSSIEKIEKTGTDVLVDTYTITLTDGSKQTFTVTNGKGIDSIEKTDTDVLIDTYTITFNDGDTQTFTVSNGKGIDDIEKTSQGLVDTYEVTFNDGTSKTFTVTNGRAIVDIQITKSEGLKDIYTIYFNDDTTLDIPFIKTNVEMDTELSDTSEMPVQNKVITQAVSHIGQIIHTTTLDTLAKVKAIYGGHTNWIQHTGYVLRGASSGVVANDAQKTGGEDKHTITESEMPSHRHNVSRQQLAESAGSHSHYLLANGSRAYILKDGGNEGMSSFAGYKNTPTGVYSTQSAGAHTHYISAHDTDYTGSGNEMNNMQNYKSVYIWERVS